MAKLVCSFLYVGQGDCTFLEYFDNDSSTKPDFVALVDFGSVQDPAAYINSQSWDLDHTFTYLEGHIAAAGKLDLLLITHGDKDHYNLIPRLLNNLEGTGKKYPIHQYAFGGSKKDYTVGNVFTSIEDYGDHTGQAAEPIELAAAAANASLLQHRDLQINLLAANLYGTGKATAKQKNGQSLVTQWILKGGDAGDVGLILCGDATKEVFENFNTDQVPAPVTNGAKTAMMNLPHHGSITTAGEEQYQAFATTFEPEGLIASAGFKTTFAHPNIEVFGYLDANVKSATGVYRPPLSEGTGTDHLFLATQGTKTDWKAYRTGCLKFTSLYTQPVEPNQSGEPKAKRVRKTPVLGGHGVSWHLTLTSGRRITRTPELIARAALQESIDDATQDPQTCQPIEPT